MTNIEETIENGQPISTPSPTVTPCPTGIVVILGYN